MALEPGRSSLARRWIGLAGPIGQAPGYVQQIHGKQTPSRENRMIKTLDKTRLIPLVMKLSDRWFHTPRWKRFRRLLIDHSSRVEDFFFVQVGANDGVTHDLLFEYVTKFRWQGLLVEPVKDYFDELKQNYQGQPGLIFENLAISDREEIKDLYRIENNVSHLPGWCKGMGSFHIDVLLKHKWAIPNIEDYILRERVACVPLMSLLARHHVERVDLLCIDTEGHDFEIIKQLDFQTIQPVIILYERKHLSEEDQTQCIGLLRDGGYSVSHFLGNTLAYLPH